MNRLRVKDFNITSKIVREPIHEDQCWYYIYYNGRELHKRPTKTDARRYISELVKFANIFLVEYPDSYPELVEKVNQAKKLIAENNCQRVHPILKESIWVVELLEPLARELNNQQNRPTVRSTDDVEKE